MPSENVRNLRVHPITPERRALIQSLFEQIHEAADQAPKELRLLFLYTMPRAPKVDDTQGAWDHYSERLAAHCTAFADVCRAIKKLTDQAEANAAGRVH